MNKLVIIVAGLVLIAVIVAVVIVLSRKHETYSSNNSGNWVVVSMISNESHQLPTILRVELINATKLNHSEVWNGIWRGSKIHFNYPENPNDGNGLIEINNNKYYTTRRGDALVWDAKKYSYNMFPAKAWEKLQPKV